MSQEKNTIWSINGLELEMDLDDAETLEKYEKAFTEMDVQEKEFPKDGKTSEIVRRYCDLYYRLFENLFGKDNADKIVQKKYHMGQWEEVYASFLKLTSIGPPHTGHFGTNSDGILQLLVLFSISFTNWESS